MKPLPFLLSILLFFVSCQAQTDEAKMMETSNAVLDALAANKVNQYKDLIGVDLLQIGKNEELLGLDFKKITTAYRAYAKTKKPEILITNELSPLGSRKVIIPLGDQATTDSPANAKRLELYFGPPNFVSLHKIANYKFITFNESDQVVPPPGIPIKR